MKSHLHHTAVRTGREPGGASVLASLAVVANGLARRQPRPTTHRRFTKAAAAPEHL